MNTPQRRAEIAGAGFAGLAAAIALRLRGWSVRVHEADAQLREAGAGIFLWRNGLASLDQLGIGAAVRRGACFPPSSDVVVDGARHARQETNTPATYPMATMTRQHLHGEMLERARALGAEILASSPVAGADPAGSLILRDGSRLAADLVIGADGVQSAVRDSLAIATRRQRFDDGIIRTLVRHEGLPGDARHRVVDHWVTKPLPRRVLYVPCAPGVHYLAMMARVDDERGSATPPDPALWSALFPDLAGLFAAMDRSFRHDVYRSTSLAAWSRGRVAILGDAAHAMPPTLGQGAGFAIGNALALAEALDVDRPVSDSLAAWEAAQRPPTESVQQQAEALARLGPRRIEIPKGVLGEVAGVTPVEKAAS